MERWEIGKRRFEEVSEYAEGETGGRIAQAVKVMTGLERELWRKLDGSGE